MDETNFEKEMRSVASKLDSRFQDKIIPKALAKEAILDITTREHKKLLLDHSASQIMVYAFKRLKKVRVSDQVTKPIPITPEERVEPSKPIHPATLDRVTNRINRIAEQFKTRHGTYEDLKKNLNRNGTTYTDPSFSGNSDTYEDSYVREHYKKILMGKITTSDEKLLNRIITHRDKILKDRITCTITLYDNKGVLAVLNSYETLIEVGAGIANFWQGNVVDPSTFGEQVDLMTAKLSSKGLKNTTIVQPPTREGSVTRVQTTFSFA